MANTGTNTSNTNQAVVNITATGCITEGFASDLAKSLKIEFPSSVTTDGRIDQLSSTAVVQISNSIVATSEFQVLLSAEVGKEEFIKAVAIQVGASPDVSELIVTKVGEGFEDEDNLEKTFNYIVNNAAQVEDLAQALVTNTASIDTFQAALQQNPDFEAWINAKLASNASDIVDVQTDTGNLSSGREHVVVYPTSIAGDFIILANVSGGGDTSGWEITSKTSTQAIFSFPNGAAGDSVTVTYALVN